MGFEEALSRIKAGHQCARKGWNGKGMCVGIQYPDEGSKNTLPYFYLITVTGDRVPWTVSQTDALANDWEAI
jgi:hypothetical protein